MSARSEVANASRARRRGLDVAPGCPGPGTVPGEQASTSRRADEQTCLLLGAWGVRREGTGREGVSAVGRGEGRGIGVSGGRGEG